MIMIAKKALYTTEMHFYSFKGTFFCEQAAIPTLCRYLSYFDELFVTGRIVNCETLPNNVVCIPPNITILGISTIGSIFGKKTHNKVLKIMHNCDMVVAHIPSFISYYAIKQCRKNSIPFITVVVGCAFDGYWNHGVLGKAIAPIAFLMMRKAAAKSLFLVYVTKSFLQKRYPSKGKYINASNVRIEKTDNSVIDKRIERISNYDRNTIYTLLTCAAVNVRHKGQDDVIKAIYKIKKSGLLIKYYLAGIGDQSYLMKLTKKYRLDNQVEFLGLVKHDKIYDLLDSIDIYVQPSKQEGLPRALIEAMSRGCLCIGSNTAGIPELIDEMWVFKKGHVNDLKNKILSMIACTKKETISKINYVESQNYLSEILDPKREKFFMEAFVAQNGKI